MTLCSAQTVGVIFRTERDSFRVLDQNGQVRLVQPHQISMSRSSNKAIAVDSEGHEIRVNDNMKETDGEVRRLSVSDENCPDTLQTGKKRPSAPHIPIFLCFPTQQGVPRKWWRIRDSYTIPCVAGAERQYCEADWRSVKDEPRYDATYGRNGWLRKHGSWA